MSGSTISRLLGALVLLSSLAGCGGDIESRMAEVRALQDVGQFAGSIEELREILTVAPDLPELPEVISRLRTGALNVNRGTLGASLRLPSVGLGRSSNGIAGGIDLMRFLATPRSTLVETRLFDAAQAVPGVNWESAEDEGDPETLDVEMEELEELP